MERLLHGATLRIQIQDGIGAIVLIQIQQLIIMQSWVTRLLKKHGAIYFTRRMEKLRTKRATLMLKLNVNLKARILLLQDRTTKMRS